MVFVFGVVMKRAVVLPVSVYNTIVLVLQETKVRGKTNNINSPLSHEAYYTKFSTPKIN